MSYFIVLHGTSGSGKTTNAEKLAKFLKAKHISLDLVLKENMLNNHKPGSCSISSSDFIKGLDIIIPLAINLLKNGQIVIFDGCIYHKKVLNYLLQNIPYENYVFTLKAPLTTCIERDKSREITLGENVAKGVHKIVKNNNYGKLIYTKNKSISETVKEIILHLPKDK